MPPEDRHPERLSGVAARCRFAGNDRSESDCGGLCLTEPGLGVACDEKDQAATLEAYLASVVALAQPLRIHMSNAEGSSAELDTPDVALKLHHATTGETAADLLLGDPPQPRLIATAVPWSEVPQRLVRLVKAYQVERCGRDTFATWTRTLPDGALRERLGLPEAQPTGNGEHGRQTDGSGHTATAVAD